MSALLTTWPISLPFVCLPHHPCPLNLCASPSPPHCTLVPSTPLHAHTPFSLHVHAPTPCKFAPICDADMHQKSLREGHLKVFFTGNCFHSFGMTTASFSNMFCFSRHLTSLSCHQLSQHPAYPVFSTKGEHAVPIDVRAT